jgi:hypothetical protein
MVAHRVLKTGGMAVVPFTPGESSGEPQFVKMLRDTGQGERVVSMGFISHAVFEGDTVQVTVTEPEGFLAHEPLRFKPPMIEHSSVHRRHRRPGPEHGYQSGARVSGSPNRHRGHRTS